MSDPVSERKLRPKPLRFVDPACYRLLLDQLADYHLHAFDVHASVMKDADTGEVTIFLRYGDGPVRKDAVFPREAMERLDPGIADFFRESAKDCKKTLIADYYKLMKV